MKGKNVSLPQKTGGLASLYSALQASSSVNIRGLSFFLGRGSQIYKKVDCFTVSVFFILFLSQASVTLSKIVVALYPMTVW